MKAKNCEKETNPLKINHISIKSDIMLSLESIHKILNAANRNLRNLELSKRKKKEEEYHV